MVARAGTVPLTIQPPVKVFDLDDCVGQRSETFRFYLVDGITGENKGEIHPVRDSPATLRHDAGRTIPRSLRIVLNTVDVDIFDPIRDRVLVYMSIGGGTYPLGRYMASDPSALRTTAGLLTTVQMVDEMFRIDQKIDAGFASLSNATVMAVVLDLLETVVHPPVSDIEASAFIATGGWSIGTNRGQILEALATQGDYLRPWMNHNNVFRMIRTFDPATAVPTFDYDTYKRVLRDSEIVTNDLLDAPNRFVVTSNNGSDFPIVGTADIPLTAPHSIPNRGFVVVDVDSIQLTSQTQAQAIAEGRAATASVLERTTLSTPPDPRHDGWDVILWQGVNWLETGWSMELEPGGEMTHELQRAYL